jgi:hypothetical protein
LPPSRAAEEPDLSPPPAGDAGQGDHAARAREPQAVVLAGDILRWVIPAVGKFPRSVRYGLGSRIEAALTDVLEELVVAQYGPGAARSEALARANRRLQVGRHLLRIAVELGHLSRRQGLHAAKLLVELGTQVGAWQKSSVRRASSSAS